MKRKTVFVVAGLLLTACLSFQFIFQEIAASPSVATKQEKPAEKRIRIQPLGSGCSEAFIREAIGQIRRYVSNVELSPRVDLPASAYYRPRGRYRADSLIQWMGRQAKRDEVILGITTVDISTTKNEHVDWGVMGLGFCPGNAAVASPYRMKNRADFWKVAIHELGHTVGLPHCPVNTCFMRDADGGNPKAEEKEFCPKCRGVLVKAGWSLRD